MNLCHPVTKTVDKRPHYVGVTSLSVFGGNFVLQWSRNQFWIGGGGQGVLGGVGLGLYNNQHDIV